MTTLIKTSFAFSVNCFGACERKIQLLATYTRGGASAKGLHEILISLVHIQQWSFPRGFCSHPQKVSRCSNVRFLHSEPMFCFFMSEAFWFIFALFPSLSSFFFSENNSKASTIAKEKARNWYICIACLLLSSVGNQKLSARVSDHVYKRRVSCTYINREANRKLTFRLQLKPSNEGKRLTQTFLQHTLNWNSFVGNVIGRAVIAFFLAWVARVAYQDFHYA